MLYVHVFTALRKKKVAKNDKLSSLKCSVCVVHQDCGWVTDKCLNLNVYSIKSVGFDKSNRLSLVTGKISGYLE